MHGARRAPRSSLAGACVARDRAPTAAAADRNQPTNLRHAAERCCARAPLAAAVVTTAICSARLRHSAGAKR
eukprot:scaffold4501_cov395-Prasinococcus_capsulatus_cf.AAC.9